MRKTHLLTIDPQNDFCTPTGGMGETGQLLVPGADKDMERLAAFITKNQKRLSEIHCTLDSHQAVHIAHPTFWVDSAGNHPNPFTLILVDDVKNGTWRPFNPAWQSRAQAYVDTLATNKRYVLCIWPLHCLIGTWGHAIVPEVAKALYKWEREEFSRVNFVAKGSNLFTEHYSGVQADVPDDTDPSTKLNVDLIKAIVDADEILITGQALSHCVANTVTDIANNFGDDNIKKFTLLEDTTSNVTGFEKLGQDFVKDMCARGMQRTTTANW
jgi:nicotinamidase/pyrazinamidase